MCACNGGTIANAFGDLYKGSVSVIGLGSVGVCGIIYAQYNQKPPVIITGADTDDNRRSLVGKMFEWIPIETVPHYEANIILECSGSTSGRKKAIDLVLPNGLVCFIGYGEQELYLKPSDHMILKQVTMRGIYAMPYDVLWDLIGMDSTNGLDFTPAISEIMPLEDAPRAFEMIRKREAIKIILSLE
jgi:threonine dehydrogenase-like Zn-dependent dehydrogenase